MSLKEMDKLKVLQGIAVKEVQQKEGVNRLGITDRHMRRLYKDFRQQGLIRVGCGRLCE